jgi:hypothetical protein
MQPIVWQFSRADVLTMMMQWMSLLGQLKISADGQMQIIWFCNNGTPCPMEIPHGDYLL